MLLLLLLRIHATPVLFFLLLFVVLLSNRVRIIVLLWRRIVRPICRSQPVSEMRGAATGVHGPRRSGRCGGVRVRVRPAATEQLCYTGASALWRSVRAIPAGLRLLELLVVRVLLRLRRRWRGRRRVGRWLCIVRLLLLLLKSSRRRRSRAQVSHAAGMWLRLRRVWRCGLGGRQGHA